jgi:D-serine deaminase-like pyridoxal phosphate-dependent protein
LTPPLDPTRRPAPYGTEPVPLREPLPLDALPTPALVLDLAPFERNLAAMARHLARHGVRARPHTKTHKCPEIGRRQIAAGAVGLCCAKPGEAEVMADAGLDSLLLTSPVATADKAKRVAALAARCAELLIVVDSELGAKLLSEAAAEARVELGVLVDLDPGTHRTGVALGETAARFTRLVRSLPHLRFEGLQAYAGHLQHVHGFEERRLRAHEIWERVLATRRLLEQDGSPSRILTGGGTGTFDIDPEVPGLGLSDVQVGSYVFMDAEYRAIGGPPGGPPGGPHGATFEPFETALFVLLTAISRPVPDRITVDGGFKAFATDSVRPELIDVEGVRYHWGGDEHGILELQAPSRPIELGDKLRVRVPHCDPTVNLYDGFWVLRGDAVTEWWPIAARGRGE